MDEVIFERITEIMSHYGPDAQTIKAIEELAEMQVVLAKILNKQCENIDSLVSECADVFIMLLQIMSIYGIDIDYFDEEVRFKLDRQMQRIREEKQ